MTKVLSSAWEAEVAGLACVRIDDSVLDQLLRGCAQVYEEIQALQDQGVLVETTAPLPNDGDGDLAVLRQTLRNHCELPAQSRLTLVGGSTANRFTRSTALWSADGSASDRARRAEAAGLDLYEPEIALHSRKEVLTARRALHLAQRIGAISTAAAVPISGASAQLVGLQ